MTTTATTTTTTTTTTNATTNTTTTNNNKNNNNNNNNLLPLKCSYFLKLICLTTFYSYKFKSSAAVNTFLHHANTIPLPFVIYF
jgi:hypothetical protein